MKGSSKQQSSEKMKKEKADQDWLKLCEFVEEMKFETSEVEASSDFEGTFQKDSNSNFRKRIRRTKEIKRNKADLKTDGIILFGQEIDDNDYFDEKHQSSLSPPLFLLLENQVLGENLVLLDLQGHLVQKEKVEGMDLMAWMVFRDPLEMC